MRHPCLVRGYERLVGLIDEQTMRPNRPIVLSLIMMNEACFKHSLTGKLYFE